MRYRTNDWKISPSWRGQHGKYSVDKSLYFAQFTGQSVLIWLKLLITRTKSTCPKGFRDKLGLVDGNVLHIEVVEKGVAKLSVVQGCRKAKLAREMLKNPPNLGRIKGRLFREEIYEDIWAREIIGAGGWGFHPALMVLRAIV